MSALHLKIFTYKLLSFKPPKILSFTVVLKPYTILEPSIRPNHYIQSYFILVVPPDVKCL